MNAIVLDEGVRVCLSENGRLKVIGLNRVHPDKARRIYEHAKVNRNRIIAELSGILHPSPEQALDKLIEIMDRDPDLWLCFDYEPQPAFTLQGVDRPLWAKAFLLFVRAAPAIAERIPELKAKYGRMRAPKAQQCKGRILDRARNDVGLMASNRKLLPTKRV